MAKNKKMPAKPKFGKKPKQSASLAVWENWAKRRDEKISDYEKKVKEVKAFNDGLKKDAAKKKSIVSRVSGLSGLTKSKGKRK